MSKWLDTAAAVAAFVAAAFWFASAYGKLPKMISYWGYTPETDPYYLAIQFSAKMNRWAAGFSGLSALCMSISLLVHRQG